MARTILLAALGSLIFGTGALTAGPPGLPRPPHQDDPWTPPKSNLPAAMVDATRLLFEQGLADPRGCAYRQVELAGEAGPFLGVNHPVPTHAFVLPFDATGGPRYAVAWNGLVYPVEKLGPAADLDAEVRVLTERSAPGGKGAGVPYSFSRDPMRGGRRVSHLETAVQGAVLPTGAVLLLRLGRADLAGLVWKSLPGLSTAPNRPGRPTPPNLYTNLAADWQWALYDRAAAAHEHRDDRIALVSLRELARIRPLIAARVVVPNPPAGFVGHDFLVQLPEFLADQERRAREPAPGRTSPDRDARIAALIRDFDEISGAPSYFSGRGHPGGADVVRAIIKEGDAAVGPLLDCLERDDRLTRIVDRDFRHGTRYLHVQGVDEAAYVALCGILGTRELGPRARYYGGRLDRASRRAVADEIRAYWKKNRGLGPLERLFRTLAGDEATKDQWLDAAEALAQPGDGRGWGGLDVLPHRDGGKVPPSRGEPLRSRAHPSITELMARRAREIEAREAKPGWFYGAQSANRMARFLAAWDLPGSLPTLRERVARSAATIREAPPYDTAVHDLPVEIAQFTVLRVKGGDPSAIDDYAAWVRTRPWSHRLGHFAPEMFEPLWRYPDRPAIAAASRSLFDDPASSWVPPFGPDDVGWGERGTPSDVIVSPMLGVAAFRKQVIAGLTDDRPSGSVSCDAAGKVTVVLDKQRSQLPTFRDDDPDRPRPGTSMPLRVRDKFAWKLAELAGFPRFALHWPRDRRDRAIAGATALLTRYGERFRTNEISRSLYEKAPFYPRHQSAVPVFEPLDRPATAADVTAGRAIFAATPGGEVRRWPMPAFPMEGRWMEMEVLRGDIYLQPTEPMPPKYSSRLYFAQRGLVWQAEEVREGPRWRRYYGFVGRHAMTRVPAEELDFPSPWNTGWSGASRDLEARLVPPGGRDDGRLILREPVPAVGPLPIVLTLRNLRGIEAAIPTDWNRPGEVPALREGVTIRLRRQPDKDRTAPVAGFGQGEPRSTEPWPEVADRREPERYRSSATTTLAPTATAEVLRLDLRPLYGPLDPGHYRIDVELAGIRAGAMFEVK